MVKMKDIANTTVVPNQVTVLIKREISFVGVNLMVSSLKERLRPFLRSEILLLAFNKQAIRTKYTVPTSM